MASPEGRVFGRPRNRQALNRACHFLELPPSPATRSDSVVGFIIVEPDNAVGVDRVESSILLVTR
jgi:hypothetical protein